MAVIRSDRVGKKMVQERLGTDASHAASAILAHREMISTIWYNLLGHSRETPGSDIISTLSEACLIAFASYLQGDDSARPHLARYWNELNPGPETVAEATVAMSIFPEALRQACAAIGDCPFTSSQVVDAATKFVARTTTAILQTIQLTRGDGRWAEISREIEEQRQQRIARMGVLTDIARAVSTTGSLDALFEQVHALCGRVLNVDNFLIALYDAKTSRLIPQFIYYEGQRRPELEGLHRPAGLARLVTDIQEPVFVADYLAACAERGITPDPLTQKIAHLSFLAAPMVQSGETMGVIAILCPPVPNQQDDLELLSAVARQTAVALENSRLIAAERRRVAQLKAVNQLARRIVSVYDTEEVLLTAVDLVHELFGYDLACIFITDQSANELVLRAHSPRQDGALPIDLRLPLGGTGIVVDVATTSLPALVSDVREDHRYFSTPETASTCSELAVPIVRDGIVLGVLDVQSPRLSAFDNYDLTTLTTITDQIAIALENARLIQEERTHSRALSLMLATTRAAGSSLVLDEVLERVASGIAEAAEDSICTIYLLDDDGQTFSPCACVVNGESPIELAELRNTALPTEASPALGHLLSERQPVIGSRGRCSASQCCITDLLGPLPAILVPLVARDHVLGLALVASTDSEAMFSQERIRLIQGVADSAALAVENARLYAKSQGLAIAEERGRLAHEIHDGLAQGLTGISLQLDLADAFLPNKPEQAREKVRRALELTRANLEEARRSVLDLRAARLQEVSLPDALRRLAQQCNLESGIDAQFAATGLQGRLSARVEIGLLRIAEEALDNIRRHASARKVRVALRAEADRVTLTIKDDGVGFDPQMAAGSSQPGAGFGLVGVRERARLLKGSLNLRSTPGKGTKLVVTVPYEASQSQFDPSLRG